MPKNYSLQLIKQVSLARAIKALVLQSSTKLPRLIPGQFLNLKLPPSRSGQFFLPRPFSIADCQPQKNRLTLVYKIQGEGTLALSQLAPKTTLSALLPLGNSFPLTTTATHICLIGGGVGVAPLYFLAQTLARTNKKLTAVLGAASRADLFYGPALKQLGCRIIYATLDGTSGYQGTVLDALSQTQITFDQYYACGPMPMLRALIKKYPNNGFLSLEARLACGFGACMGCTCQITGPAGNLTYQRLCSQGPVFPASALGAL